MYSQNNEEEIITKYFGGFKGKFLDIGAYNGKDLSNTYRLAQFGWAGVCVEASPRIFEGLKRNHLAHTQVACVNYAITMHTGQITFYDNTQAVATTILSETNRWKGQGQTFTEIIVPCKTFADFYQEQPGTYNFISIDIEGMDVQVLKQIDLNQVGCKCLCIEWNGNGQREAEIKNYVKPFGLKEIHRNGENLIYAR